MKRAVIVLASLALVACGPPAATKSEPAPAAPATTAAPPVATRTPEQIAAIIATLPAPYNGGVYDNGKRVFATCRSCHTVEAGGPNRVGPHLHGVFGRPAGSVADFQNYSAGLKASGIVWDAAKIDAWIANPRDVVAVNNMVFPGVRKDTDRRDLVAYLKVESSD